MSNEKYNALVREIAEEMAVEHIASLAAAWRNIGVYSMPPKMEDILPQCEVYARIALKRMADEVEAALLQSNWHKEGIDSYLFERGLIPEQNQPGNSKEQTCVHLNTNTDGEISFCIECGHIF
jgi:hypothetical protein